MGELGKIEEIIDYYFNDQTFLHQALTHPSIMKNGDGRPFERMEFLGDRVLGLVIAELLYKEFPEELEGELARRLSFLVCKEMLIEVSKDMGLQAIMLLPEDKGTGIQKHYDTIWSDGCEALLGAIYLDGGLEPAHAVVSKFWVGRMRASISPPIDPKNELQEWSQSEGLDLPTYTLISQSGPDHAPEFIMEATLEIQKDKTLVARGAGPSKKAAEKAAAAQLLAQAAKKTP